MKKEKSEVKTRLIALGFGLLFLFLSICIGLYFYYSELFSIPQINDNNWSWLNVIPFIIIAKILGYIVTVFLGVIGIVILIVGMFGEFEYPKSKKFVLPKELASTVFGLDRFIDEFESSAASEAVNKNTGKRRRP